MSLCAIICGLAVKKKKIENLTTPSFPLYQLPSLYMLSSFCDEGRKVEASFLPSTFAYTKQSSCPRSASQVSPGSEHLTLLGGPVPCLLTSPPHVASQAALWCCWTVSRNAGPAMIPCGDTVCHSSCPPPISASPSCLGSEPFPCSATCIFALRLPPQAQSAAQPLSLCS